MEKPKLQLNSIYEEGLDALGIVTATMRLLKNELRGVHAALAEKDNRLAEAEKRIQELEKTQKPA